MWRTANDNSFARSLGAVDEVWLRAWVHEGIITTGQYQREMRRRRFKHGPWPG